eukprot:TRINITY_DN67319_c0_g1_i1.p1 TRINITY_DN67319_c0_g1~~TRINITY_DN67319_c0_g1_i1.p1  ORF type:complete len:124 (+),score=24.78 TRINITY_DN67319_c0_g1_i1:90-461(+)
MTFASHARWAFARNAHCSSFARQLNIGLRTHRSLAASPLLRLAAEYRPPGGFAEQQSSVSGLSRSLSGEEFDERMGVASSQAVAAILQGLAGLDKSVVPRGFGDMLEITVQGACSKNILRGQS